jgi:DNA-binding GntR family transcriptional regulator
VPRRSRFIAHLIQRGIAAGEFSPGTILPAEAELADRYRASPEEVRLALARLDSDGLIVLRDDLSAVVRQRPTQTHYMSAAVDRRKPTPSRGATFSEEARRVGLAATDRIEASVHPATLDVADQLGIGDGELVVHRRTVRIVNDQPSVVEDSYYPRDLVAGPDGDAPHGDMEELLDGLGYVHVAWLDAVAARAPSPDETVLLALEQGVPVIDHRRVLYSMQLRDHLVRPVSFTRTVFAGDRNRLIYQHKQSDAPRLNEPPE